MQTTPVLMPSQTGIPMSEPKQKTVSPSFGNDTVSLGSNGSPKAKALQLVRDITALIHVPATPENQKREKIQLLMIMVGDGVLSRDEFKTVQDVLSPPETASPLERIERILQLHDGPLKESLLLGLSENTSTNPLLQADGKKAKVLLAPTMAEKLEILRGMFQTDDLISKTSALQLAILFQTLEGYLTPEESHIVRDMIVDSMVETPDVKARLKAGTMTHEEFVGREPYRSLPPAPPLEQYPHLVLDEVPSVPQGQRPGLVSRITHMVAARFPRLIYRPGKTGS